MIYYSTSLLIYQFSEVTLTSLIRIEFSAVVRTCCVLATVLQNLKYYIEISQKHRWIHCAQMACVKRIQNNMLHQKSVHTSRPHTYWQGRRKVWKSWEGCIINLRPFQGQGFASIPDKFGGDGVPPTCSRFWQPWVPTTPLPPPPVPTGLTWPNIRPTLSFLVHSLAKMSDVTYRIHYLIQHVLVITILSSEIVLIPRW